METSETNDTYECATDDILTMQNCPPVSNSWHKIWEDLSEWFSLIMCGPMTVIDMDAKTSHLLLTRLCMAKKSILVNWKWRISSAQFSKVWSDHICVVRTAFSKNQSKEFHHFWSPILFHDLMGWGWFGLIAHGPNWGTGWCRGGGLWVQSLGGLGPLGRGGWLRQAVVVGYASPRGSCLFCLLSAPGELSANWPSYQGKGGGLHWCLMALGVQWCWGHGDNICLIILKNYET